MGIVPNNVPEDQWAFWRAATWPDWVKHRHEQFNHRLGGRLPGGQRADGRPLKCCNRINPAGGLVPFTHVCVTLAKIRR